MLSKQGLPTGKLFKGEEELRQQISEHCLIFF